MSEKGYSVRLSARVDSYVAAMKAAEESTAQLERGSQANLVKLGGQLQDVGRRMTTYVTLPIAAAGVGAVVAATQWESSWAGVAKTVDGTASQMTRLEDGLRSMAKELPATHGEIAGVAEAAGQLGVGVADIEEFTRVMIDLGETTNLTADQAATSLARFSNIMGTPTSDVRMLADVIVELGNNSATTEAEIVELGTRLAAAGKIAGLSEADVFAFAATLTSVGVEAEAGGTALSKVFTAVRDAVLTGSDSLATFATVAGQTTSEFAAAFNADPAQAIAGFIAGLGRMNAAGQSTTAVFEDLELSDQRLMRALLSTGEAGDLLTDSLAMANEAADVGGASAAEAAVRYETFGAKMEMLRNQVVDLAITVGGALIPAIEVLATGVGAAVEAFAAMPAPVQLAVGGLLALLAAAGPVIFITGSLIKNLQQIHAAAALLKGAGLASSFVGLAGPIGAVAAILAAAGFAFWKMGNDAKNAADQAAAEVAEMRAQIAADVAALASEMDATGDPLETMISNIRALALESPTLADALDATGFSIEDVAKGLLEMDGYSRTVVFALQTAAQEAGHLGGESQQLGDDLEQLGRNGHEAAGRMDQVAAASGEAGEGLEATGAGAGSAREQLEALLAVQAAYIDEVLRGISSQFDYEKATYALTDSTADLAQKTIETNLIMQDSNRTDAEKAQALRDLRMAQIGTMEQALQTADAYAKESGATANSTAYVQAQIDELDRLGDEHPELRGEIDATIDTMLAVPGTVDTRIDVETAEANRRIDETARRLAVLDGRVARTFVTNTVTNISVQEYRTVGAPSRPGVSWPGLASGGPAKAGHLYEVGEGNVAEMFVSGGRQYMIPGNDGNVIPGSKITPAAAPAPHQAAMAAAAAAGGRQAPPMPDPVRWGTQAADAISRRLQRNGRAA
jgi:TP901 family phage tail tape measure protein